MYTYKKHRIIYIQYYYTLSFITLVLEKREVGMGSNYVQVARYFCAREQLAVIQ